jgi:hypothetical protein
MTCSSEPSRRSTSANGSTFSLSLPSSRRQHPILTSVKHGQSAKRTGKTKGRHDKSHGVQALSDISFGL